MSNSSRHAQPIFYRALLLTGVNLLLRLAGTTFQVFLSRKIGAGGIGLLQLVLSVGSLATIAGIAGVRTATMYLTAEALGRGNRHHTGSILSSCFGYSIVCSCAVSLALYLGAPVLAQHWIGDPQTAPALRIVAGFLPAVCLSTVMSGYFTAANRIGTLAAVEVAEQLCSMGVTLLSLAVWAKDSPARSCLCVVLGNGVGSCVTVCALVCLRLKEHFRENAPIQVGAKLRRIALPLAGADILRSGIGTAENLLVPRRLALYPAEKDPMSAFGTVSGMVFPVMMFPACILFALAELLIPELARCQAAGNRKRIQYLVHRGLWSAMIYGIFFAGLLFLFSDALCRRLYDSPQAGEFLKYYAMMVPFLYCDAITDAMTKGLGQQRICVRYNIITSALDVVLLFLLLPRFGMAGYFFSFLISHLLNFLLSLHRLTRIASLTIPFSIPALAASAGLLAAWAAKLLCSIAYVPMLLGLLWLFGILSGEDIRWAKQVLGLTRGKKIPASG